MHRSRWGVCFLLSYISIVSNEPDVLLQLVGLSANGSTRDVGYLLLLPFGYSLDTITEAIFKKYIIPAIRKEVDGDPICDDEILLSPDYDDDSTTTQEEPRGVKAVLSVDGDMPQWRVLTDPVMEAECEEMRLAILKFAAACSLLQQPNDRSKGFLGVKSTLKGKSYKYNELEVVHQPQYMQMLTKKLRKHRHHRHHQ